MKKPLISVIIPMYNKKLYIKRAIKSVLDQTISDFEIIVINDGSTDHGEDIVANIHDSRIQLINQENKGVSAARNKGINEAKADLIAFLDADDEWFPDFLKTILNLRETYPEGGLYETCWYCCDQHGLSDIQYPDVIPKNMVGILHSPFKYATEYNNFPCSSSACAIPKYVFEKIGMFKEGIHWREDKEMWCRIALFYPVVVSGLPMGIYHKDIPDAITKQKFEKMPIYEPFLMTLANTPKVVRDNYHHKQDLEIFINSLILTYYWICMNRGFNKEARFYAKMFSKNKNTRIKLLLMSYMPPRFFSVQSKYIKRVFFMIKNRLRWRV